MPPNQEFRGGLFLAVIKELKTSKPSRPICGVVRTSRARAATFYMGRFYRLPTGTEDGLSTTEGVPLTPQAHAISLLSVCQGEIGTELRYQCSSLTTGPDLIWARNRSLRAYEGPT